MANWISAVLHFLNNEKIAFIALLFALYEYRKRTRVETVVRNTLRRLAGDIKVVYQNAAWSEAHVRTSGNLFAEDTPDLLKIRKQVFEGARDAATCARQLSLVHSQIRGLQQSLFNDSEEIFPDIQADDVKAARAADLALAQKNDQHTLPQ
jgi:hypothetical protein